MAPRCQKAESGEWIGRRVARESGTDACRQRGGCVQCSPHPHAIRGGGQSRTRLYARQWDVRDGCAHEPSGVSRVPSASRAVCGGVLTTAQLQYGMGPQCTITKATISRRPVHDTAVSARAVECSGTWPECESREKRAVPVAPMDHARIARTAVYSCRPRRHDLDEATQGPFNVQLKPAHIRRLNEEAR